MAKGVSIILVAFSHSHLKMFLPALNHTLALFRVPLFFFLSGIFFREMIELKSLVLSKTDSLLKPYFVTLVSLLTIGAILGTRDIIWEAGGILYGNGDTIRWAPLWFLPHLWALHMFSYLIFSGARIQQKTRYHKISLALLLLIAGVLIVGKLYHLPVNVDGKIIEVPGLPFSLDLVFISSAYFISGRFLREHVKSFKPKLLIVFLALSSFILIAIFTAVEVDLNERIYNSPLPSTIEASLGIYLVLSLVYFLNRLSLLTRILCYTGKASLFILIFHAYVGGKIDSILCELSDQTLYISILSFICSLTAPLIIRAIVIRSDILALFYLPLKSNKLLCWIREARQKAKCQLTEPH
jgi:fucose 4-O-acetylase-like acetyltransferase